MKTSTKLKIVWRMNTLVRIIHSRNITRKYLTLLNKAVMKDIEDFKSKIH